MTFAAADGKRLPPDHPRHDYRQRRRPDGRGRHVGVGSNWVSDFVVVPSGAVLGAPATLSVRTDPYSVAVGDFTGDGKPDLVVADDGSNASVLLGTATAPSPPPRRSRTIVDPPYAVAVGDFNGDGKLDLAVANYGSDRSGFSSARQRHLPTPHRPPAAPHRAGGGRLHGNGNPDLVVANYGHNNVEVLLNNGNGTFATRHLHLRRHGPRRGGGRLQRRRPTRPGRSQLWQQHRRRA